MIHHLAAPSPTRRLLAGAALLVILAGCASTPPTVTPGAETSTAAGGAPPGAVDVTGAPTADPNAKPVTIELVNTEVAPGPERIIFRVKDEAGQEVTDGNVTVGMYRLLPDGRASRSASGAAAYFGAGQPGGGTWAVYTEFDSSGPWGLEVDVENPALG